MEFCCHHNHLQSSENGEKQMAECWVRVCVELEKIRSQRKLRTSHVWNEMREKFTETRCAEQRIGGKRENNPFSRRTQEAKAFANENGSVMLRFSSLWRASRPFDLIVSRSSADISARLWHQCKRCTCIDIPLMPLREHWTTQQSQFSASESFWHVRHSNRCFFFTFPFHPSPPQLIKQIFPFQRDLWIHTFFSSSSRCFASSRSTRIRIWSDNGIVLQNADASNNCKHRHCQSQSNNIYARHDP